MEATIRKQLTEILMTMMNMQLILIRRKLKKVAHQQLMMMDFHLLVLYVGSPLSNQW
jgi:hypothetical protein